MRSINEQLNIRVPNNPNIPSRYTRGLNTVMPQLGSEDWSLDYYNDMRSMENSSNADGNTGGKGLSSGAKIGIGVGALAIIGIVAYVIIKKRK